MRRYSMAVVLANLLLLSPTIADDFDHVLSIHHRAADAEIHRIVQRYNLPIRSGGCNAQSCAFRFGAASYAETWEDKTIIEVEKIGAASLDELAAFRSICHSTAQFIQPSLTDKFLRMTFSRLFEDAQRRTLAEARIKQLVLVAYFHAGKTIRCELIIPA